MSLSAPTKITTPWATSGLKVTIPAAADNVLGRAGWDLGFPPINLTAKEAGGIPPFGQDMNGLGYAVSQALQWAQATGGLYPYDSTYATAITGYPAGALVARTDNSGYWRNTVAGNTTDPEAFGAGWQPEQAGVTTVAMSNANVTLTALQAGRSIIVITGTLTANLNLIFPTYAQQWLVVNSATGAYSVTCKTASGTGVAIVAGSNAIVYGDGTNINALSSSLTGVSGARSNLAIGYTGTTGVVTVTANALSLTNSSGLVVNLRSISLTATSGAITGGAGGLDMGSWAYSTWYNLFVIYNPTTSTSALLWSLSATAPTLPSGYTYFARIGANKTQSATNYWFLGATQYDKKLQLKPAAGSNVTSFPQVAYGTSSGAAAISISAYLPPTASHIQVLVGFAGGSSAAAYLFLASSLYGATLGNNAYVYQITQGTSGLGAFANESSQSFALESTSIYWNSNCSTSSIRITGWEDNL